MAYPAVLRALRTAPRRGGRGDYQLCGQLCAAEKSARLPGLRLATCCEQIAGVRRAACIDRERIEWLIGCPIEAKKDPGQRPGCGCIESVDVGAYGSCQNGCRYSYATRSAAEAERNWRRHDPASPLLIGWPEEGLIVREKELRPLRRAQQSLF